MTAQNAGGVDARIEAMVKVADDLWNGNISLTWAKIRIDEIMGSAVSPDAATVDDAMVESAAMALQQIDDCSRLTWDELPDYGKDRLRDHARAALQAARLPDGAGGKAVAWRSAIRKVMEENQRLRVALMFYGKHDSWMGVTEDAEARTLLVAAGGRASSMNGWAVAEDALAVNVARLLAFANETTATPAPEPPLSREGASVSNAVRDARQAFNAWFKTPESVGATTDQAFIEGWKRALATPNPTTLAETAATPAGQDARVYTCDYCGKDYTDARTRYCCNARREYLNAHGMYETPTERTPQREVGWIAWSGGPQPVANDVRVSYRMRTAVGGCECVDLAGDLNWNHNDESLGAASEIIAYKALSASAARSGGDAEFEPLTTVDALKQAHADGRKVECNATGKWARISRYYLMDDDLMRRGVKFRAALQPNTTGEAGS